jgi:hypothetical protein
MNGPDLTQRPPRSPRVRLGGYVILPRMLDKGRATINGLNGEFHFNCPLDEQFLNFAGIEAAAVKELLAQGQGDAEILAFVQKTSKRTPLEIAAWSEMQDRRVPTDVDSRKFFQEYHEKLAPHRSDVATWFDILDIDDHVTFGGKA